jgi:predicted Zn-dependent protease
VNEVSAHGPTAYREIFETAILAFFTNQPEKNRELLIKGSRMALSEGRLGYHELFQGELSFAENSFSDALKHYEVALKEEPSNSLFLSNHATTLFVVGKPVEAEKQLRQALAQNPDDQHSEVGLLAAPVSIRRAGPGGLLGYSS